MRTRSRLLAVAAVVLSLSVIAGAFIISPAKADEITDTNLGRVDRPVYNNNVPANGIANVAAYGTKLDTVGDGDNEADKHRAEGRNSKISGVAHVAVQAKLQRNVPGYGWITSRQGPNVNSRYVGGQAVRSVTPTAPFLCGTQQYRSYVKSATRFVKNNTFEAQVVISRSWFVSAPPCPILVVE